MENKDGIRYLNFRRNTSSGVPFCFTIEAGDGTAGCIAKEIFSFVSAAVPEQCAREWMIQSGAMEASEFANEVLQTKKKCLSPYYFVCYLCFMFVIITMQK